MHCSSKCAQQPLVKNAGAITPAQSESVNATKPSCHILRLLLNPSILQVNWLAEGRAADAADTKGFGYTATTKALLCLTACLFPTHQRVTRSLTSFTTSSAFSSQTSSSSGTFVLRHLPLKRDRYYLNIIMTQNSLEQA